jgi:O-acetyl-ADP-ribose deacetylase (regulator of RNase III)
VVTSPVTELRIILAAVESPLADAWERFCGDVPFVTVHRDSILDIATDAVVSPANSYGFMDGGIDALYLDHFGPDIQSRVRRQIYDQHAGELLVGVADIVETGHETIPFLIAAPTMRVPMVLHDSPNAYLAARAVFLLIQRGKFANGPFAGQRIADHVRTVALPGLGTGVGRIGFNTCARQVRAAIDDVLLSGYEMPRSWAEASERHQLLYTDRPTRLQY